MSIFPLSIETSAPSQDRTLPCLEVRRARRDGARDADVSPLARAEPRRDREMGSEVRVPLYLRRTHPLVTVSGPPLLPGIPSRTVRSLHFPAYSEDWGGPRAVIFGTATQHLASLLSSEPRRLADRTPSSSRYPGRELSNSFSTTRQHAASCLKNGIYDTVDSLSVASEQRASPLILLYSSRLPDR